MTIETQSNKAVFTGNGATIVFPYTFIIPSSNDLIISLVTLATGTTVILNPTSYSVTGIGDPAGGSVTYPLSGGAPITAATSLVIEREVSYVQETDLTNQGGVYPQDIEDALDFLTMQTQQINEQMGRAVQFPITDTGIGTLPPAAARAGKYFTFDALGQPTASSAVAGSVPVSVAIAPLLNSVSTAAFAAALGALLGDAGVTSAGSANAQTIAFPGYILANGTRTTFKAGFTNTGAATLNVNGTGAIGIRKQTTSGLAPLIGTEITVGTQTDTIYDGTFHILLMGTETTAGALTNIASAATTDLGTIPSNNVNITGSVAITSFGSSALTAEPIYYLTFAANAIITHNPASIICPAGNDIVTGAGDAAIVQYLGAGIWRVVQYTRSAAPQGTTIPVFGGLVIVNNAGTPNTKADISSDFASGNGYYGAAVAVTLDVTTGGSGTSTVNGMDGTARVNSSWLNIFFISNGAGIVSLGSASATAPVMPTGYRLVGRIGAMRIDSSGNFLRTKQVGGRAQYVVTAATNTATMPTIVTGLSGSSATPTYTSFALTNFIPPTATVIRGVLSILSNSTGQAIVAPNQTGYGSVTSATNPPPVMINLPSATALSFEFVLESFNIFYASSSGSTGLFTFGWIDKVNAY